MNVLRIFFLLLVFMSILPISLRGLERLYEQSFLIFNVSNCFKKRTGFSYQLSFFQKSMVEQKMEKKLDLFIQDPEKYIKSCKHVLLKTRGNQKLFKIFADSEYILKVYEQKGFLKNLFKDNRIANSASGAFLLEDCNIKSHLPVAVVIKRGLNRSKGYHLSRGLIAQNGLTVFKQHRSSHFLEKVAILFNRLKDKRLIHGDLTPMNVLVNNCNIHVIDTSDVHEYPKCSPLFFMRHAKETSFCFRHFDYE